MKPFVRDTLLRQKARLHELDALLSAPDVVSNLERFRTLSREHADASVIVEAFDRHQQREADLAAAQEMLADPEMADMAQEEIEAAKADLEQLDEELQHLLLPRDPDDERPAFVEIRAGTGGDESALFAGDLARLYTRYADSQVATSVSATQRTRRLQGSGAAHGGRCLRHARFDPAATACSACLPPKPRAASTPAPARWP
jgi:peptide chain release factor 1